MKPYVSDSDLTLCVGDVLDVLRELPAESIDCVVTSPPYFGLRDYGDEAQIGLEKTPEEYVARLVEVFREVRRVLADHGAVFLNLGDSYAAQGGRDTATREDRAYSDRMNPQGKASAEERMRGSGRSAPLGHKHKDLIGIPWLTAFALRADGWWLRSEIIWAKPNPMPESVTDRPTKSHEQIFLLTKKANYYWDQEAVREPWATTHAPGSSVTETQHYGADNGGNAGLSSHLADVKVRLREAKKPQAETLDGSTGEAPRGADGRRKTTHDHAVDQGHPNYAAMGGPQERWPNGGRNIRSVWTIATQPFAGAHFAVFPEELVRRCILAGCPERVCQTCGVPQERIVGRLPTGFDGAKYGERAVEATGGALSGGTAASTLGSGGGKLTADHETIGFTDCGHNDYRPGIVLDPFGGAGTTALVARKHGRHSVLIELNPAYAELAAERLNQLSLFAS